MSSNFVRGALVQINKTFGVPTPNVTIFQYNPEGLVHAWTPAAADYYQQGMNPLAVRGLPAETFTFTLVMDASDQIAEGHRLAIASGIQARLAALEMLLFPIPVSPDPAELMSVGSGPPGLTPPLDDFSPPGLTPPFDALWPLVPAGELPVVLFVWGAARVVPVRVQSLSVNETLYDSLLNPTHAEASITLQVLTKQDLANVSGITAAVARGAYSYTHAARRTLAIANLENAREGVIGMIPFL